MVAPRFVLPQWIKAQLNRATHAFWVGHHGREAPVSACDRDEAAHRAVGVVGVDLCWITQAIDKTHGPLNPLGVALALKIGLALPV